MGQKGQKGSCIDIAIGRRITDPMKVGIWKAFVTLLPCALVTCSALADDTRTWTFAQDGKTEGSGVWSFRKGGRMDADFVRMQGENSIVLRSTDGQERIVPVSSLSQKDRDYITQASRPVYHVEKEEQQEAKPTEEAATAKSTSGSSPVTVSSFSHSTGESKSKRSSSSDKAKTEHVSSYTKKDGTHVNSYNRRPPH